MSELFKELKVFQLPIETAKSILQVYIEKDTGKKVKDITFTVATRVVGYHMNENNESYLKEIEVEFE